MTYKVLDVKIPDTIVVEDIGEIIEAKVTIWSDKDYGGEVEDVIREDRWYNGKHDGPFYKDFYLKEGTHDYTFNTFVESWYGKYKTFKICVSANRPDGSGEVCKTATVVCKQCEEYLNPDEYQVTAVTIQPEVIQIPPDENCGCYSVTATVNATRSGYAEINYTAKLNGKEISRGSRYPYLNQGVNTLTILPESCDVCQEGELEVCVDGVCVTAEVTGRRIAKVDVYIHDITVEGDLTPGSTVTIKAKAELTEVHDGATFPVNIPISLFRRSGDIIGVNDKVQTKTYTFTGLHQPVEVSFDVTVGTEEEEYGIAPEKGVGAGIEWKYVCVDYWTIFVEYR